MGWIYKITNSVNDKMYIGKTVVGIEHRWNAHKKSFNNKNRKFKSKLYRAMECYGVEKFTIECIEECDDDIINERERYWIATLDTVKNGYNIMYGGEGNQSIGNDDEDIMLTCWNQGMTIKEIESTTTYNHKLISRVLRKYGITRQDILDRQQIKIRPKLCKCVYAYDLDGNYVAEYESLRDASKQLGIHHTSIGHIASCNHGMKSSNGLMFRYYKTDKIEPYVAIIPKRVVVYQYSLDGDYIATFSSYTEAALNVGLKDGKCIKRACQNERATSAGYFWRTYKVERLDVSAT